MICIERCRSGDFRMRNRIVAPKVALNLGKLHGVHTKVNA